MRTLIGLAVVAATLVALPAQAKKVEPDGPFWHVTGLEAKKPKVIGLDYSVPESDYLVGGFSCTVGSGVVDVWISETSDKLKPGKKATAVLAVGETKASVTGKLLVNEDAGAPSFDGTSTLSTSDPIFTALSTGKELVVTIGPSKDTLPLKGVAAELKKFLAACTKK